ncbi:MAG: membrane protein insertase YidC, partial [Bryobacteraceae bacterium]
MSKEPKEMSHEFRTLLAAVLSLVVIVGFSFFYKPKPPQVPATPPGTSQPSATQPGGSLANAPAGTPGAPASNNPGNPGANKSGAGNSSTNNAAATPAVNLPHAHAATAARKIVVESALYHVELSNQGAVVRSWQLQKYTDDNTPPRTLDVVHPDIAQLLGGWPMSLVLDDAKLEASANSALYDVSATGDLLHAPAEVDFSWSDGHLEVTKKLNFDASYIASMEVNVTLDGQPIPFSIAWRGGFGDATAYQASAHMLVFNSHEGKVDTEAYKNLGQPKEPEQRRALPGPLEFVGIEDAYFTAAFLPRMDTT